MESEGLANSGETVLEAKRREGIAREEQEAKEAKENPKPVEPPQPSEAEKQQKEALELVPKTLADVLKRIEEKEGPEFMKDTEKVVKMVFAMGVIFGVSVSANTVRKGILQFFPPNYTERALKVGYYSSQMVMALIPGLFGADVKDKFPILKPKVEGKEEVNGVQKVP